MINAPTTKPEQLDARKPVIKLWKSATENSPRVREDGPSSFCFFIVKYVKNKPRQRFSPTSGEYVIREESAEVYSDPKLGQTPTSICFLADKELFLSDTWVHWDVLNFVCSYTLGL